MGRPRTESSTKRGRPAARSQASAARRTASAAAAGWIVNRGSTLARRQWSGTAQGTAEPPPAGGGGDDAREQRQARSAWSMVAAVALHAAALVSWPASRALAPQLQATLDPSAVESAQPEWLFMDQAIASAPKAGDGGAAKPQQGSN